MKTNLLIPVWFYLLVFLFSCQTTTSSEETIQQMHIMVVDPGFSTYIEEYSGGIMPVNSPFSVKITPAVAYTYEKKRSSVELSQLFSIQPSVKGEISYRDGVFTFKPDENLKEGSEYRIFFHLKNIIDVPSKYEELTFNTFTLQRNFSVSIDGLKAAESDQNSKYSLEGEILTSVQLTKEEVEQIIKAEQGGDQLTVEWDHNIGDNRHRFSFKDIRRKNKLSYVDLSWNGKPIGVKEKGEKRIEVPASGEFRLIAANVIHQPEQQIKLLFSDPLSKKQDIDGLVAIVGAKSYELSAEGNMITVYLKDRLTGQHSLVTAKSIKNFKDETLPDMAEVKVDFELLKPALRLPGRGVIMPDTGSVVFPFEAVNLKAVDLRVIKIFPSNMSRFLQNSNLQDENGSEYIKHVGKLVYSKRVDLITRESADLNKWNAFSIDLSKHLNIEKGAVYQVEIGMQKAYSLFRCSETPDNEPDQTYDSNKALDKEKDYWQDIDNNDNNYVDRYYSWKLRDNPCSKAYYTSERSIRRNILVSNIGLTVKKGTGNDLLIACADLQSASPLGKVKLEVFNLQLQSIATGESNDQGFCSIQVSERPFLLIASRNEEKSYLKLNDANALSLSQFDVSGEKIQEGIKGFIYTERGVWRPGDSIYVSLFIEDKLSPLPDKHPVLFKLINTKGQIIQEQIQNLDRRLLTFRTATPPDCETGNWKTTISVGGAEFSKYLRIETVKPNRLKINFSAGDLIRSDDPQANARIESSWLTGINAPELHTVVDLTLRAGQTKFGDYPLYCFDDNTKSFKYETKTLIDTKTDQKGSLLFPVQPGGISGAPGMLNADFTVRIFEPGGDASIRQFTKKYSPYNKYVGLFIPRTDEGKDYIKVDENAVVKLISVNPSGDAVTDQVNLMIYKMEWRWWWESSDQNIGSYINRKEMELVASSVLDINKSPVSASKLFSKLKWGRYMIVAQSSSGHTTSATVYNRPDYYYEDHSANQATMLNFTSDKKKYTAGENIRISFPAPDKGRALVTIENGTGVLDKFWMETKAGNNNLNLKAKEIMAPCSYVHISLIQPFGQNHNDNPIRMYGVVAIPVENPGSRLNPVLQIPSEFRPERKITLNVSEKNGRAMNYTIAMVDEGLLDLTGFNTPDPWSGMNQREALGVRTWDLYDDILGSFGGRIEKLFAIGGDMNPLDPSKNKASRFKPVVLFAGPFSLKKGQSQKHEFTIPAYTGSVRTMVIAGDNGSYGSTEKTSAVKSPLMLLPVAPRSLGLNEEIAIPVSVFSLDASLKEVRVKMECSSHFTVSGANELSVNFPEKGEKSIEFKVRTAELTGNGKIIFSASSGTEKTRYEISIPVKSKEMSMSRSTNKMLGSGEETSQDLIPFGIKGSNKVKVTVSGLPSINLYSRLNYLISYPHGCTEQTISSVFPQLYLSGIENLSTEQKNQVENHVKAAFTKLKSYQNTDGSFGFWPGMASNDEWLTSYAGHFFCETEQKGFNVPGQMKENWLNYQTRIASEWKGTYSYQKMIQAYRLYTLALSNKPVFSAMNRLREDDSLPSAARWFLAGAYAEAGRPEAALELIDMRSTNSGEDFNKYTFGDQTRDRSMLLLCLIRLNDQNNIFTLYQQIAKSLNNEEWMNTQTTAFALIAVSKAMEKLKVTQKGLAYAVSVNKKMNETFKTSALVSTALDGSLPEQQVITIKNTSPGSVFINYYTEGIPKAGSAVKTDRNIETGVRFLGKDLNPIDITNLRQGSDFLAVVQVKNTSVEDVSDCAMTFQVPSGWEIRNTRLFNQITSVDESSFDYRDFRDDKVSTYFNLKRGEVKKYVFILNASYLGRYYLPNIQTEAMYDKKYLSVIPGMWIEVRK